MAGQKLTPIEIDHYASEPGMPFGIITADRDGTQLFDDGIAVTPLPAASEMYRVSVFVVDTSHLYLDDDIVEQVIERKETQLMYGPQGLEKRVPLLDDRITRDLHFSAKSGPLGARVVSFIVGKWCPPKDISVSYGQVEVTDNLPYDTFGGMCRDRKSFKRYGRAAAQIMKHLSPAYCDDEVIYRELMEVDRSKAELRGLNINKAFMLGGNHLGARVLRDEERVAAFRTNFYRNLTESRTLPQPIGRYSITPGPHERLGFDVYAPFTSPMWQAAAFMNHGQLLLRELGKQASERDIQILGRTVARLNERADTLAASIAIAS